MSSLMNCPVCHKSISVQARSCPSCGHPLKPQPHTPPPAEERQGIGFWGIVGAVVVAVLILSFL